MFNYLFPIFAFGLVITGIVFLGLQHAADLAKELAGRQEEMDKIGRTPTLLAAEADGDAAKNFRPPTT